MDLTRRDFLAAPAFLPGPRPNGKLRMGVVGGRFGASFYWHEHPDSEVAAVCDLRADRRGHLAKVYRCPAAYDNFAALARDKNVDAIAVFTPAPLHVEMALEALRHGKHVISAVPAAVSLEECEKLIDGVKRSGLAYMMAETSRYRYEIIECIDWARAGVFGTIFYSEAEYHHEGLESLFVEDGQRTWRYGFPPMHYITHSSSMPIAVTGERFTEVTANGWGDNSPFLKDNVYRNPFWSETAFFKTSGGHSSRISVFWRVASGGTERGQFFGDQRSFQMPMPGGQPAMIGYPDERKMEPWQRKRFWERLPEPLRHESGHGGSHTHLTHEFVDAVRKGRRPSVDVYEAVAYTAPGFYAHQSALEGGRALKIKDFGRPL